MPDDRRDPSLVPATDPRAPIYEMMRGWWRFTALNAWVRLGCSDHLAAGPLTAAELAERCDAHPPALARLLRTMASLGFIQAGQDPDRYRLTDLGAVLRDDVEDSMRPGVLAVGEPVSWEAMGRLDETVRAGRSTFEIEHGSVYEYYADRPELQTAFSRFMTTRSRSFADGLTGAYDFTEAGTLVDVGGGNGTILAAVLAANPHLRGTLLDLATVVPDARRYLADQGLADRSEVVAGDFCVSVPAKADLYLLASVLHNWPDDKALRILRTVRAAMTGEGRLLLLDILLPDAPDQPHLGFELDIRMLALFGEGLERTRHRYLGLLEQGGFQPLTATELRMGATLVAAAPA